MTEYGDLPTQTRTDIDEMVTAYYHGSKDLANRVFKAIIEARKLTKCEAVILGDLTRTRLKRLGYLPTAPGRPIKPHRSGGGVPV